MPPAGIGLVGYWIGGRMGRLDMGRLAITRLSFSLQIQEVVSVFRYTLLS